MDVSVDIERRLANLFVQVTRLIKREKHDMFFFKAAIKRK